MPSDPRELLDRQRSIAPPPQEPAEGEPRSTAHAPNSVWTLGVVRAVNGDVISWQRMRYKRGVPKGPPKVGEYEAYGPVEKGYPLEGMKGSDYSVLVFTAPVLTEAVEPIRAAWRNGFWIMERIAAGGGSIRPARLASAPAAGASTLNIYPVKRNGLNWDNDGPAITVPIWGYQRGEDFTTLFDSQSIIELINVAGEWHAKQYIWFYDHTPSPTAARGTCVP